MVSSCLLQKGWVGGGGRQGLKQDFLRLLLKAGNSAAPSGYGWGGGSLMEEEQHLILGHV